MAEITNLSLGIDVGSVSINIITLDRQNQVRFSSYTRTEGQPVASLKKALAHMLDSLAPQERIRAVGATGSGRQLAGLLVGADLVKNEITAHATATLTFHPDVRTIFEIGGQDSKIIIVRNQMVVDFAMNTICAAGTGSFLDHQAERLKIPIEQFGDLALGAKMGVRIAGRCTVFAESDMIAKQQFGFSKGEIIRGLCEALVRNYINNLGRGRELLPPYVFQGGVAANRGIKAAFERELKHEVLIPRYYNVMGAIGAAILAREYVERTGRPTNFHGKEALSAVFRPTSFDCGGCANNCEVVKVVMDGQVVAIWGDKCGKWTNSLVS